MSKPPEVLSDPDEQISFERRNSIWYLNRFERSFSKLVASTSSPIASYGEVKFGNFSPEFYTPVVLRRVGDNNHEILIDEKPTNGYRFRSHLDILEQYQLADDFLTTFNGFLFVSQGRRFLLVNALESALALDRDEPKNALLGLVDAFYRYRIDKVFSARVAFDTYEIKPDYTTISVEDFIKNLDRMFFDDWTFSMAKNHRWTVFEWLRFRMTKEAPERKSKQIP